VISRPTLWESFIVCEPVMQPSTPFYGRLEGAKHRPTAARGTKSTD